MEKQRHNIISTFSAQITATISVALVLLVLGIISLLGIAAHTTTTGIKENMGFNITLTDSITERQVNTLKQRLGDAPYTASLSYFSPDDAMNKWKEDTGEDLMQVLGVNPFSGELEVKVKADYANSDSISTVIAALEGLKGVSSINVHTDMVDAINKNMRSIALVLSLVAAALLFISFALINNTVRLTVYSRRFIIHTMKLVGACAGFIRRPFINSNILSGLIAGVVASTILGGALAYLHSADTLIATAVPWKSVFPVLAALPVLGIIICALAALFATNKYLRLSYDEMFK